MDFIGVGEGWVPGNGRRPVPGGDVVYGRSLFGDYLGSSPLEREYTKTANAGARGGPVITTEVGLAFALLQDVGDRGVKVFCVWGLIWIE